MWGMQKNHVVCQSLCKQNNNWLRSISASRTNKPIASNIICLDSNRTHQNTLTPLNQPAERHRCLKATTSHNNGIKTALIPVFQNNSPAFLKSPSSFHPENTSQIISLRDKAFYFTISLPPKAAVTCVPVREKCRVHVYVVKSSVWAHLDPKNGLFFCCMNQSATLIYVYKTNTGIQLNLWPKSEEFLQESAR